MGDGLGKLLSTLPIDIADDVAPGGEGLLNLPARRAVAVSKYCCVLQELALRNHLVESGLVDEIVVAPLDLALPRRTGCDRDRQGEPGVTGNEPAGDRGLARSRRRGKHEQKSAPVDQCGAHSMFCTCSRNCSTAALSESPIRVSSISADFEHKVLASRLNSWHKKSKRRPTASSCRSRSVACSICARSRSISSRISERAMSNAISCATRSSGMPGARSARLPSIVRSLSRIAAGCAAAHSTAASTKAIISTSWSRKTAPRRAPSSALA